jgi:hypothetical protein
MGARIFRNWTRFHEIAEKRKLLADLQMKRKAADELVTKLKRDRIDLEIALEKEKEKALRGSAEYFQTLEHVLEEERKKILHVTDQQHQNARSQLLSNTLTKEEMEILTNKLAESLEQDIIHQNESSHDNIEDEEETETEGKLDDKLSKAISEQQQSSNNQSQNNNL